MAAVTVETSGRNPSDCIADTPFFTVSHSRLLDNVAAFSRALPGTSPFYAVKANPELSVLSVMDEVGVGFEAASIYEVELLRELGISGDRVIFGTAVKPAADIRAAFTWGVSRFAADSPSEIMKLGSEAPGAEVYLRVHVNDSGAVFPLNEKFGAQLWQVDDLIQCALASGLRPCGLSFHVGSQASRVSAWSEAITALMPALKHLAAYGSGPVLLNIGGGFPCQYDTDEIMPSIGDIGASISQVIANLPAGVEIIAEPGRFLVASAVSLTTSVIARAERSGTTWLFLDAGCYNGLFEAMSYQGHTRYPVRIPDLTRPVALQEFSLAGPTGDVADVIARNVLLPGNLAEGDRVVFENVGAYTMSMSVPFNGFPKPRVVVQ